MRITSTRSSLTAATLFLLGAAGCAPGAGAKGAAAPASALGPLEACPLSLETEPSGAPKADLAWADFSPATFARAKAEHKFVVMDGAAEWCHWCHVMEATTYHDPRVQELLAKSFIAVKIDVDSRPDLEQRYAEYGWPATVIFSPNAEEIGKYRGYIAPDDFVEILRTIATVAAREPHDTSAAKGDIATPARALPVTEDALAFVTEFTTAELDEYFDDQNGGWGRRQKAPVAANNAWSLTRAAAGDTKRRDQALFTLDQQRKIIDPVWGGIYQYSTNGDWEHAHFEKLMTFQAGALENYAMAFSVSKEPRYLNDAQLLRRYVDTFMTSPEGGFYATQDADLNAHDRARPYMTGHAFYALGDGERRALGAPRVDTHEYAKENGLAMAAYVTFYETTGDATALATARRAAKRVATTHASARGGVSHDAVTSEPAALHLSDNAAYGFGLMRIYDATKDAETLAQAVRIADFILRDLEDREHGGFFGSTEEPNAVGVFRTRRKPYEENVMAVRFLARVAKATTTTTKSESYRLSIANAMRPLVGASGIKARGRNLGDLLSAIEETREVR